MSKRQKACLQLDGGTVYADTMSLAYDTCPQKDAAGTAESNAQQDQDVERRKFKTAGGLFEKVLTGQMSLQDAQARGLQLTLEQEQLYRQVRAPATLFW